MAAISFSSSLPGKDIYAIAGDPRSVLMRRDEEILVRFCGEPGAFFE